MAVKISDYSACSSSQWLSIWSQCAWASWFESPRWWNVWQQTYGEGFEPAPVLITFSDGIQCVLPAVQVKRLKGSIKVYEISPAGTYGGPLSSSEMTRDHLRCIISFVSEHWHNFNFRLNPYLLKNFPDFEVDRQSATRLSVINDFTQSIQIDNDYTIIDKNLRTSQVRRDALSAGRNGLFLDKIADNELIEYLKAYEESQSRWQQTSSIYPKSFFKALKNEPGCTFWGIRTKDGDIIGGGPVLEGNCIATSWLGLMKTEALKFRPFELFYYELIHIYRERGFKWLDLNPSGGNEGVVRFKNKFGPEILPSPFIQKSSSIVHLLNKLQILNLRNG